MNIKEIALNQVLNRLVDICREELEMDETPKVSLIQDRQSIGGGSFGTFNPDTGEIQVVSMNRHPMDVMRTVAHELVHWKQRSHGQEMNGETGSDCENQANAIAGSIMRILAKSHPEFFM